MKSALSGEAEEAARVQRELQALQRSRAKLLVTVTNPVTNDRESRATVVEQVRENDVIIGQPSTGGVTRPLAAGERVQLQFASSGGLSTGEARVLGRIKLPSGGKRMFFGYRVTIPMSLRTVERRQHLRIPLDAGIAPVVHLVLEAKGESEPNVTLSGQMQDISLGGTQIKLDGGPGPVNAGSKLRLVADFPPPVGSIAHPVKVARVLHDTNTGETRLGLEFFTPVPHLDQFLETLKARLARQK